MIHGRIAIGAILLLASIEAAAHYAIVKNLLTCRNVGMEHVDRVEVSLTNTNQILVQEINADGETTDTHFLDPDFWQNRIVHLSVRRGNDPLLISYDDEQGWRLEVENQPGPYIPVSCSEVIAETGEDVIYMGNNCDILRYELDGLSLSYNLRNNLYVRARFYTLCRDLQSGRTEANYVYGYGRISDAVYDEESSSWTLDEHFLGRKTGWRRVEMGSGISIEAESEAVFNRIRWSSEVSSAR